MERHELIPKYQHTAWIDLFNVFIHLCIFVMIFSLVIMYFLVVLLFHHFFIVMVIDSLTSLHM